MQKSKLLKSILIPTLGVSAIGTIATVSTSCSCGSENQEDIDLDECVGIIANADSTLELVDKGLGNHADLQYSTNGTSWNTYSTTLNIYQGETLYLKGNNPTGWSRSASVYLYLSIEGDVSISGNVMGLLDNGTITGEKGDITDIPCDYCFYDLFNDSTGITSVSENFLPATTLANNCYDGMFYHCTALTTAPELPATTLVVGCYNDMFQGCSSLTTAPELPATTLAKSCYGSMFRGCTSLTSAPELLAATLASDCYESMFQSCSSLTLIKIGYTGNYDSTYFNNWVSGVATVGAFYYNGNQTPQDFQLPSSWWKAWNHPTF